MKRGRQGRVVALATAYLETDFKRKLPLATAVFIATVASLATGRENEPEPLGMAGCHSNDLLRN